MAEFAQYECFRVGIDQKIAHVQLCRPEAMNSMTKAFWLDLPDCLRRIEAESDARVVVISSTGKHFSAGMDLGVFSDPKAVPMSGDPGRMAENLRRIVLQIQDTVTSLEKVRLPVLAAVQGGCIGGALDMVWLPKLMPEGVVRELAYTGRKFGAEEAYRLGFVNAVFDDQDALLAGVMDIAASIAANSPLAVTGCKEMLNFSRDHSVEDSLKYMATWQAGMFRPTDMMKTFQARGQKQAPEYDDLFPVKGLFSD